MSGPSSGKTLAFAQTAHVRRDMIENRRNFTITTIHITRPIAAAQLLTHENKDSSTAHQFSCCIHRLKRSRTSPHSPGPQPGTLTTASGADDAVDVSHRQQLSTSSSYCCCCEPRFDPALLESRHDALNSPRRLCIRVPSPLAVETTSASCARRGGTCCEMVAVARF